MIGRRISRSSWNALVGYGPVVVIKNLPRTDADVQLGFKLSTAQWTGESHC